MALSDEEQRILQQMEEQLRAGDPDLARQFGKSSASSSTPSSSLHIPPRMWALMGVLIVVGLLLLVVGVSIPSTLASVAVALVGFACMVGGVTLPFSRKARRRLAPPSQRGLKASSSTKDGETFMERQNRRWDQRQRK